MTTPDPTPPASPNAEPSYAERIISWLQEHRATHTDWAEWFEEHPDDPRCTSDLGDAAFHRQVEARYNEMIAAVRTMQSEADATIAAQRDTIASLRADVARLTEANAAGSEELARNSSVYQKASADLAAARQRIGEVTETLRRVYHCRLPHGPTVADLLMDADSEGCFKAAKAAHETLKGDTQ